ncbi:MAG: hypothetical protein NT129_02375 [Candidatus Aenigmarchaeota archaeon]|nr:hypothetical protein [Candidatus Aenigmarchaeota archaeon]
MTEYQGMPLLEAAPVILKGEPLLQAKNIAIFLTNRGITKLHNRFDFPEDKKPLHEKLKNEFQEGWLGKYNKGHYEKFRGIYIIDFPSYQLSIITKKYHGHYLAISAINLSYPVLNGDERVRIKWMYEECGKLFS